MSDHHTGRNRAAIGSCVDGVRFMVVDPRSSAAVEAMERYFDELDERIDGGFDPGDTIVADADQLRPPLGRFVVAVVDATPVACGGVQTIGDGIAEIKRMWVAREWRGRGIGRTMLGHLEEAAADLDHRVIRLDTNSVLVEAIEMYRAAGYVEIERYNDNPYARHWFEKPVR